MVSQIGKIVLSLTLCAIMVPLFAVQTVEEVEAEIKRIRKELVTVQNERAEVADKMKADKAEFKEYREAMLAKMRGVRTETDSINKEVRKYRIQRDSLESVLSSVKRGQKSYELQQDQFRQDLMVATERAEKKVVSLSPSLREKPLAALKLLKGELKAKTVDNVEASVRLFTIIRDVDNGGSTIQIAQGNSPVSEIRGSVYRLRIGTLLEAVVSLNGTRAGIWKGVNEKGDDMWESIESVELAGEILKAVNVREGKALPELVSLPFASLNVYEKGMNGEE